LESLKFNEDKTAFVDFDREYAESKGLGEKELVNIEVFFELENEAFQLFKDTKLELENQNDNGYSLTVKNPLKDIAILAAVIASIAFVGKAIITKITNDLYNWEPKSFVDQSGQKNIKK